MRRQLFNYSSNVLVTKSTVYETEQLLTKGSKQMLSTILAAYSDRLQPPTVTATIQSGPHFITDSKTDSKRDWFVNHFSIKSYNKGINLRKIMISLASSRQISRWAERILPNGKIIGKITNANTLHFQTFKPQKGGLFCERIFGPLRDFECACGHVIMNPSVLKQKKQKRISRLRQIYPVRLRKKIEKYLKTKRRQYRYNLIRKSNKLGTTFLLGSSRYLKQRTYCPICDVQYTLSIFRRYQLGYIELILPVAHVWFFKGTTCLLGLFLGLDKNTVLSLIYNNGITVLEISQKSFQKLYEKPTILEPQQSFVKHTLPQTLAEVATKGNNLQIETDVQVSTKPKQTSFEKSSYLKERQLMTQRPFEAATTAKNNTLFLVAKQDTQTIQNSLLSYLLHRKIEPRKIEKKTTNWLLSKLAKAKHSSNNLKVGEAKNSDATKAKRCETFHFFSVKQLQKKNLLSSSSSNSLKDEESVLNLQLMKPTRVKSVRFIKIFALLKKANTATKGRKLYGLHRFVHQKFTINQKLSAPANKQRFISIFELIVFESSGRDKQKLLNKFYDVNKKNSLDSLVLPSKRNWFSTGKVKLPTKIEWVKLNLDLGKVYIEQQHRRWKLQIYTTVGTTLVDQNKWKTTPQLLVTLPLPVKNRGFVDFIWKILYKKAFSKAFYKNQLEFKIYAAQEEKKPSQNYDNILKKITILKRCVYSVQDQLYPTLNLLNTIFKYLVKTFTVLFFGQTPPIKKTKYKSLIQMKVTKTSFSLHDKFFSRSIYPKPGNWDIFQNLLLAKASKRSSGMDLQNTIRVRSKPEFKLNLENRLALQQDHKPSDLRNEKNPYSDDFLNQTTNNILAVKQLSFNCYPQFSYLERWLDLESIESIINFNTTPALLEDKNLLNKLTRLPSTCYLKVSKNHLQTSSHLLNKQAICLAHSLNKEKLDKNNYKYIVGNDASFSGAGLLEKILKTMSLKACYIQTIIDLKTIYLQKQRFQRKIQLYKIYLIPSYIIRISCNYIIYTFNYRFYDPVYELVDLIEREEFIEREKFIGREESEKLKESNNNQESVIFQEFNGFSDLFFKRILQKLGRTANSYRFYQLRFYLQPNRPFQYLLPLFFPAPDELARQYHTCFKIIEQRKRNLNMKDFFSSFDLRKSFLPKKALPILAISKKVEHQKGNDFVLLTDDSDVKKYKKKLRLVIKDMNQPIRRMTQNIRFLKQVKPKLIRRIKLLQFFLVGNSDPESMLLKVLPVLPADLRPIMKLGGEIAVSDLNRLYQKIIYRNDRLKTIIKQPKTGYSNETRFAHRLLQEAVDNLIDNGKSGIKAETDSRGRALKSFTEILKGKSGRFRQNLLGKRVDYSGRSVIVVGPKLKLHECGIPYEMASELFLPFLLKRIFNSKIAKTLKGAKTLIRTNIPFTKELLREIMRVTPVLLNRAPTLHRLGIQAFQPKLIDGKAILLHPLVCPAFNADFDGDQMGVHVPITVEARAEALKLMFSRNNLLSAATGDPLVLPSQDMVLGSYYLTTEKKQNRLACEACYSKQPSLYVMKLEESNKQADSLKVLPVNTNALPKIILETALPKGKQSLNDSIENTSIDSLFALSSSSCKKVPLEKIVFSDRTSTVFSFSDVNTTLIKKDEKATQFLSTCFFNSIESALMKYSYDKIVTSHAIGDNLQEKIHSNIWVKWQKKIETGIQSEQPLEIRLNCYGNRYEIFTKLLCQYDSFNNKINQYIQTTPGKILFNLLIQNCSV